MDDNNGVITPQVKSRKLNLPARLYNRMKILPDSLRAGVLVLLGVFLLGLSDNLVLIINDQSGIWQFHAIRSLITAIIIISFARIIGHDLRPKKPLFVLMRSVFLSGAMICYFGGLSFLSVAEAGAGLFSSPIFVLIFSFFVFRLKIGIFRVIAVVIGSIGVYILLQPDFSKFRLIQIIPLFAGMFYAMASISTRQFCKAESPLGLTLGYLSAIGFIGATVATFLCLFPVSEPNISNMSYFTKGWQPVSLAFLGWVIIQSILTVVALAFLTIAYQQVDASFLAVYEYGFLIFAAFWGWVLWSTVLGTSEITGIVLIMAAGIIIIIRSQRTIS